MDICPEGVLVIEDGISKVKDSGKCDNCWACLTACPLGLITKSEPKGKKGKKEEEGEEEEES